MFYHRCDDEFFVLIQRTISRSKSIINSNSNERPTLSTRILPVTSYHHTCTRRFQWPMMSNAVEPSEVLGVVPWKLWNMYNPLPEFFTSGYDQILATSWSVPEPANQWKQCERTVTFLCITKRWRMNCGAKSSGTISSTARHTCAPTPSHIRCLIVVIMISAAENLHKHCKDNHSNSISEN